ncbi:MAG: helix-turn-helix domain-containing protein [Tannerellaceae bacterium]
MLDILQLLLSLQIIGFCMFGGITILLRAMKNRAKCIFGSSMLLWALLAAVRLSVNLFIKPSKEIFHPDILLIGCVVAVSLACYVIEMLRPGYLTVRRFMLFVSPILLSVLFRIIYYLGGGVIDNYYTMDELFSAMSVGLFVRLVFLLFMLLYMALPLVLILRYNNGYTRYLQNTVSDPENYDLSWLKKILIVLSLMYVFYIVLLLTNSVLLYVINKATLLVIWYYFFYKALFMKVIEHDYSFEAGWKLPDMETTRAVEEELIVSDEEQRSLLFKHYAKEVNDWFIKEKPYLSEDLRLTDIQRVLPISRSYLSQLFNRELGCSFSDYVNGFRVEESKRLMAAEPESSLNEIAERSGFHSISTFRRSFIKQTGVMPSEFRIHKLT